MNYADRARTLVGCRFRPQGRAVEHGLDCVGLAAITYGLAEVPANYRLRGSNRSAILDGLKPSFRPVAAGRVRSGDLLLFEGRSDHIHLAVKSDAGFIHADVRRGVVETPGDPPWPIFRIFRRRGAR